MGLHPAARLTLVGLVASSQQVTLAMSTGVCARSPAGGEPTSGCWRSFWSLFPAWQDGSGLLPWPWVTVTSPGVAAEEERGRDEPLLSGGCRLHQGFAHQHNPGEGQRQLLHPRGDRRRAGGHPRGIGLGFQQPLSTQLLEACVGAPGRLEHPLTLSFTLSLLAAPCRKRKAKQVLPSRLVQRQARSQMQSKLSWTRSRSGAVPGSAGEKDGPRPLTGLNFAPSSKPWHRSVQMPQTPPRAALPPSPGTLVPLMLTRESWSGSGPGGGRNGASASR